MTCVHAANRRTPAGILSRMGRSTAGKEEQERNEGQEEEQQQSLASVTEGSSRRDPSLVVALLLVLRSLLALPFRLWESQPQHGIELRGPAFMSIDYSGAAVRLPFLGFCAWRDE